MLLCTIFPSGNDKTSAFMMAIGWARNGKIEVSFQFIVPHETQTFTNLPSYQTGSFCEVWSMVECPHGLEMPSKKVSGKCSLGKSQIQLVI